MRTGNNGVRSYALTRGRRVNDLHLQRVMHAAGQPSQSGKPALELNAAHAIVKKLESTQDEPHFAELALLLYEQAVLSEGGQLEDPSGFVKRINGLLLGV